MNRRAWLSTALFLLHCSLALGADPIPPTPPATALPIHILVPGFTVSELPIKLTNIDNVEYAPDGRLFAMGYDGRIHQLLDTDGDGLEDTVKPYWYKQSGELRGPVGMTIAPEGIYVASKGRISLIRDTDGDGVADRCDVVVGGWKEISVAVDALGVALDSAGNLYYGRGCEDYQNPLLNDKQGIPHYDLKSETGTVIKVSPDRKTRQIVCTGIRFTVALAINRQGDLFATDQEGATWVPGGNPVDKLTHIIPGRHYGFPPKSLNPEYLKNVVDEPNVVSFGPQHQSSCGMKFNEENSWRKPFGPAFWAGDALVAGESRGKIWRCPLVKTPAGYVGKPVLIASLEMLTLDVAISPKGDLIVCCHSGQPDWGTGPKGQGRIFKISYTDPQAPQPVLTWPAGPQQVRLAFDRPVDPSITSGIKNLIAGEYVRAADRYEVLKPPYKVVAEEQGKAPLREIHVTAQKLSPDGRTLILDTEPLPWRAIYSLAVPGVRGLGNSSTLATIDTDLALTGVEARWTAADGRDEMNTWLPHLDTAVVAHWTANSSEHAAFGRQIDKPGKLSLKTVLNLAGSTAFLHFESNRPFTAAAGDPSKPSQARGDQRVADLVVPLDQGRAPLSLDFAKDVASPGDAAPLQFHISYHTDIDSFERPLPAERLLLPWAAPLPTPPKLAPDPKPATGDWARGKALFFGEAQCSTCHRIRSEGGTIGPDLSNLIHKDADAVLRDIISPSSMINPDYVNYKLKLANGEVLSGLISMEPDNRVRITEGVDKTTILPKTQIRSITPSELSIMPDAYKDLPRQKLDDIVTFLTSPPPK